MRNWLSKLSAVVCSAARLVCGMLEGGRTTHPYSVVPRQESFRESVPPINSLLGTAQPESLRAQEECHGI